MNTNGNNLNDKPIDDELNTAKDNIIDNNDPSSVEFDNEWAALEESYKDKKKKRYKKRSSHHRHNSQSNRPLGRKKRSKAKIIILSILAFLLCVVLGACIAFFIMQHNGRKAMLNYDNINLKLPEDVDSEAGGNIIHYNGHTYEFNKNIATILFMGIDNTELVDNAVAGTAGQADALYLFTYDTVTGGIKVLSINRDTITDINRYDEAGNYYDTASTQLCLAYAYGDGKKFSAQNQVTAVERLMYNIPINCYYAIDLSAIKILNDEIGGVTLTPQYTFGQFTAGQEIKIVGDMAESFVRTRDVRLVDDNLRRMACQRQYLEAYAGQTVAAIKKDYSIPKKLYDDAAKYTVTNMDISKLFFLAPSLATNYSGLNFITTAGEYKMVEGDESAQFHLDNEKFFENILDIFYRQIN